MVGRSSRYALFAGALLLPTSVTAQPLPLPADPIPSNYAPIAPYGVVANGLLGRVESDSTVDGLRIQIVDLMIGPHQRTEGVALNGSSTLIVVSGHGQVTYAETDQIVSRQFEPGISWNLASGQSFTIENSGDQHVDVRIRIITAAP